MRFLNNKIFFLVQLLRNERRPPTLLQTYQNKKLRNLVLYSYANVPFYRDLYDKNGINPNDIKSISDALSKVILMPQKEYNMLIKAGLMQAKKFSWEKSAKETLKVLENINIRI